MAGFDTACQGQHLAPSRLLTNGQLQRPISHPGGWFLSTEGLKGPVCHIGPEPPAPGGEQGHVPSASTSVAVGARWALGQRLRRAEVSCGPRPSARTRAGSGPAASHGSSGHTAGIRSRRGLAQALGSFGLGLARFPLLLPGRPGAVSTAKAAAWCSEASTPEEARARFCPATSHTG